MKKIITLLMLMFMSTLAIAQVEEVKPLKKSANREYVPKHNITLGINPIHMFYTKHNMLYNADIRDLGIYTLTYTYPIHKMIDLGGSLLFRVEDITSYSTESNALDDGLLVSPGLYVSARFNWLNRDWVRLYTYLSIGYDSYCMLGLQVAPIGISVGKKFHVFAEASFGTQALLLTTGLGYRFSVKTK